MHIHLYVRVPHCRFKCLSKLKKKPACIPMRCGSGKVKWNAAMINVINYTWAFPAMKPHLLWKRPIECFYCQTAENDHRACVLGVVKFVTRDAGMRKSIQCPPVFFLLRQMEMSAEQPVHCIGRVVVFLMCIVYHHYFGWTHSVKAVVQRFWEFAC